MESEIVIDGHGSFDVHLHPLVLLNISDHFTRLRANAKPAEASNTTVVGALIGAQDGRRIEIFTSYELVYDANTAVIDKTYLIEKSTQFREVCPDYDILGWYTNGRMVTEQHLCVHQQLVEVNESPLLLLLDTSPPPDMHDLPLRILEPVETVVVAGSRTQYVNIGYTLASLEAERIGVDHVAKTDASHGASDESEASIFLNAQQSAIEMLMKRLQTVRDYTKAVADGELPPDHTILREIKALCNRIPVSSMPQNFSHDAADVLLVSYLTEMTKSCSAVADMLEKHTAIVDQKSRSGRSRLNLV